MTHILLWVEPHPIRGRHDEFFDHAVFLAEALLSLREQGVGFSLFSNRVVLDRLQQEYPAAAGALIRPTASETAALDAFSGMWDAGRIAAWLGLVTGDGPAVDLHRTIAARLIARTGPDAIVMWSDNGGVRQAAAALNLPVLSCELGPTRAPFPPTFYIDPSGTNGRAAMRVQPPPGPTAPTQPAEAASGLPPAVEAVRDRAAASLSRPDWAPRGGFALVPLQLADDLNTLLHSTYRTPQAFLQDVLPRLLARHETVLVKGHPGADGRPGNLRLQEDALAYARGIGGQVATAPERLRPDEQLWLLRNAGLVCALNSSLGFEALLLGTPLSLLGDAAYDLGGLLKRSSDALTDPAGPEVQAAILRANYRWFLHRMDTGDTGQTILRAVRAARRPDAQRDWSGALAAQESADSDRPPALPDLGTPAHLRGYLEAIEETGAGPGAIRVTLRGWLMDAGRDRAVDRIDVVSGGATLAATDGKSLRPDVARKLRTRTCSMGFEIDFTCAPGLWRSAVIRATDRTGADQAFAITAGRLMPVPLRVNQAFPPVATRRNGRTIHAAFAKPVRVRLFLANLLQRQRPNVN